MRQPVDPVLFASIWAGSVIALHFGRRCFHALGEWLRERGLAETLALVYGAGLTGRRLARQLARIPELGIRPLGFLDDDPDLLGKDVEGLPVLGDFSTLEHHLCAGIVRRLFIAHPRLPHRSILDIMDLCRKHSVPFQIVPSIPEQLVPLAELQDLEGIPLLGPPPLHQRRLDQVGRRVLDLIAALPLALCALPTALVLWPRRCANGQSLFVRHRRIGLHGRPILVLKFRTNREYPQRNGPERFIASLPMAWNLLRGDLSLVGPRPMTAREVENLDRMHLFRLQWRPGLTGLWRLARVEEDLFDDFEADLQYVRSQSLLLDLSILLRTLDLPWRRTRRS
jgi:lipopolysaccharide/colanic/teichoic acid biosynthesis glycosyltransferase